MGNNKIYWWILGTITSVAGVIAAEYATTVQQQVLRQEQQIMYLERTVASIDTKLTMIMEEIRRNSDRAYERQIAERNRNDKRFEQK